jgi:methyl-accepting chemotaxis protein
MKHVGTESNKLALEYAPEVKLANEVERTSLLTMYAMRGYATTQEEHYLTEAKGQLELVKKKLEDIKALADRSPNLVKLKAAVPEAQKGVANYEQLALETIKVNGGLTQLIEKMDSTAAAYIQACNNFIESQNKAMEKEIVENESAANLLERLRKINISNDILNAGNTARVGNFKSQATRDPELLKITIANLKMIEKQFDSLAAVTRKEVDLRQIADTRQAAEQYADAMEQFLATWLKREELNKLRGRAAEKVLESAQTTSTAGIEQTLGIATLANDSLNQASTVMIVGLVIALIVGSLLAFTITRGITRAITRVVEGLSEGAEQVASASSQVSSASQSLAEGSSEQAASVEETSSSLEEMSSMTRQNADNANQADTLMKEANQVVTTANQSMGDLIHSMEEISKASEETSKIIKTIDEIAFQTNLLALNAAVEAARAGEAGAGFAVVADEVRNLAMRAADAAKNTANLIEGTVKQVKDGGELVSRTNDNFGEVARSSAKVGELVAEIAAASSEQAQGIGQVNAAVNEVDKVTQQNAANAEESASAAEEMNAQAEQMKQFVAELVALVGTSKNEKADYGSTSGKMKTNREQVRRQALHFPLEHAPNGNCEGNGKYKQAAKPAISTGTIQQKSAEERIPLDHDFENF